MRVVSVISCNFVLYPFHVTHTHTKAYQRLRLKMKRNKSAGNEKKMDVKNEGNRIFRGTILK